MTARRFAALVSAAERDIAAVRRLLPDMPDQAIFHAQQAVEKLARAVCERERIAVGRTHNIGQIAAMLPDGHTFREDFLAFDDLSPAATAWRYPTPGGRLPPLPDPDRVKKVLVEIEALLPEIRDWLEEQ